tara:strand:- start:3598 stop:3873 length:276 start_codon:yes stop_codon:yes gene_type:complete
MAKPTKNLTEPYAVRLRHDQRKSLNQIIHKMSEEQQAELAAADRKKFDDPEASRRQGRKPNVELLIIRAALDDYIKKQKSYGQLELFGDNK